MDIAWQSICETICLSGPHGINWSDFKNEIKKHLRLKDEELKWPPGPALKYILGLYAGLTPNYQISRFKDNQRFHKDPKLKLLKFIKLEPITESLLSLSLDETTISNLRFYCSNDSLRVQHILNGRPLQLSESSLLALEIISSHHRQGLTQAELARTMGCDPKSVFHWLKCLISNDLIVRTPVASKKSFTYLLVLTRFLDEEILTSSSNSNETNHLNVVSSKEIRQSIINILATAPNQTMASVDVFQQTGLDRHLIKNYRRAATKLNEIGWLEYLFNDQLIGPYCRLFRLRRKPSEGLDLKRFLDSRDKDMKKKDMEIISYNTPRGVDYRPDYPIIHQIINLLAKSFPTPLTTADLSHRLDISRKYLYRLIERISPPLSSKKVGVIGAEGVGKVADFVGKEKRIKLFIINEEWKLRYLELFGDSTNEIIPENTLNTNLLSIPSTPNSTITQSSSSLYSSSTQSPSDTRTRQLRHQALLAELAEHKVLDVGKELCARLQTRLGDVRFTLDVKTLRRSADILEKEGLLKIVVTSAPTSTKTLLISPDLTVEDQIVKDHIVSIRENVRSGPLSAATQKLTRLKELMEQPDYFVEGSLPLSKLPQNSVPALTKFGFIFGVLARAQLFHQFILKFAQSQGQIKYFETMPTIFEQLPLCLYCKIIGMVRMSRELFSAFNNENLNSKPISELQESFKEELGINRKRFQAQVALLLQTLEQLQLIQGEEHFSSIKLKFAFKYNFALEVPLYNFKGEVVKLIKFNEKETEAFNEFWSGMRKISTDFQAHKTQSNTISIHETIDNENEISVLIPKPILLARYADSWKSRPNRERDLERSIRKLALELFSIEKSKRRRTNAHMSALVDFELDSRALENIQNLCAEFEISSEVVTKMLENSQRQLAEREEARRLDRLAARRSNFDSSDSENEVEGEEETLRSNLDIEHLRWSPADRFKLSLAFCILQQPHFLNTNNNPGGVKWQLAAKIFDKPKDPVIIRRQGLKLCKNYDELRKLIEIDSIVRLVMIRKSFTSGDACFKEVFDVCEKELNGLYSEEDAYDLDDCVLDHFIIPKDYKGALETFETRTEHYRSSIDSWIHSRSYRHALFLNTSGLCLKVSKMIASEDDKNNDDVGVDVNFADVLKLRQVLIYSTADFPGNPQFNLETATSHVQSISSESLKKSIDHLVSSGFASKTKGRDKYRLLGFPLAISEFLREIIEEPSNNEEIKNAQFSTITVNNSTENLSLTGIEELIEAKFAGEVDFCAVRNNLDDDDDDVGGRFDAPIVIKRSNKKETETRHNSPVTDIIDNTEDINGNFNANDNNTYHSWNSIQTLKNSIWFCIDGTFLPTLFTRSLNHVKLSIRSTPVISLPRLKTFYRAGLEEFEVEALVEVLVQEGLVQVINQLYLQ